MSNVSQPPDGDDYTYDQREIVTEQDKYILISLHLNAAIRQLQRAHDVAGGWDADWCGDLAGAIDTVRRLLPPSCPKCRSRNTIVVDKDEEEDELKWECRDCGHAWWKEVNP